jgi:transcriptional regulator
MEITMYDTLLQLPLFQGLCKNDFTNIIGKVKLHFRKYNADDIIVEQGAPCTQLIFRLNYLNILSNRAQVAYEKLWNSHIGNTEEKILNFLVLRSMKPEGKKILKIKMEDLASLIDETRINVSKVLNDLQEQGLVQLSRKAISIPALEKLTEKNK